MNRDLLDVQAGFRKNRQTEMKSSTSTGSEKARGFQKIIYFYFINYAKDFECVDHNCGKFFKRWEYQTTLPTSWEMCMQVKKQQLELDMEWQTGSKLEKEYFKAVYCPPGYLTYMHSTSCEMPGWMKQKLNQDCREKYQ